MWTKAKRKTARMGVAMSVLAMFAHGAPAIAQEQSYSFNIPAQDLASALSAFGRVSRQQVAFDKATLRGKRSQALTGRYSARQAIDLLLRGSGMVAQSGRSGLFIVRAAPVTPSAAKAPEAAETADSDEITVTAMRRSQRLSDVPMSVVALDARDIEEKGIQSFQDLSRAAPGLVVVESGAGQNRIFMRGIANGNSSTSLVGVYLDEMPVTGSGYSQTDLQLVDLERVEVLRGPQGTLYGQGSAGGTVRFITRDPELDTISGRADVEAYSVAQGDPSVRMTGVVNLPLVPDRLGIRVSGTFAELGGWVDQPDAGRNDINNQKLRDVRVKGLWEPADGLKVRATVVIHRNRGDGFAAGADADQNVFFPNGDKLARERLVDNFNLYNGTITYDTGIATLLSSTSYSTTRKRADGYATKLPDLIPGYESFNQDAQSNKVFTQEFRANVSAGGLTAVVGTYYTHEHFDRTLRLNYYSYNVSTGASDLVTLDTSEAWSVFGDASYAIGPRLELGAGVRYFHDKRGQVAGGNDLSNRFSSIDPRFYVTYKLTDDLKFYANVAKGFRSGGFSGDTTSRTFDPETVWSYEGGIKGKIAPQLRIELTGFYSEYKGIQTFSVTSGVLGGLVNSGTAHIKGLDGMIAFEPVPALTFTLSGNVTDAKIVKVLATSFTNVAGDRVDFIPDYAIAASAEYRFDWSAEMPGFVRLDYNQIGKATQTDHSANVVGYPSDTLTFLNARIGITQGGFTGELFAQNIFNENGVQDPLYVFGLGSRPRPRVIGVKVGTRF